MLGIGIRYKGAYPLKKSVWNKQVQIPVTRDALVYWHQKFRPKHFTPAGAEEYGYKKRKGEGMSDRNSKAFKRSYTGRKLAKFGHTRPLVFTGTSERLSRVRDIRVTSRSGKAVLPSGFNRRHPKSQIRMRDEVTAVSTREEKTLVAGADRNTSARLAAIKDQTNKKLA